MFLLKKTFVPLHVFELCCTFQHFFALFSSCDRILSSLQPNGPKKFQAVLDRSIQRQSVAFIQMHLALLDKNQVELQWPMRVRQRHYWKWAGLKHLTEREPHAKSDWGARSSKHVSLRRKWEKLWRFDIAKYDWKPEKEQIGRKKIFFQWLRNHWCFWGRTIKSRRHRNVHFFENNSNATRHLWLMLNHSSPRNYGLKRKIDKAY